MSYRIPFNKPPCTGNEEKYVLEAIHGDKLSGDGKYGRMCEEWFENRLECDRALLTPSCTQALEMAALLLDIGAGDEVIMPSYTFVSTANAFALRGASIVFVDIRSDTLNIDESLIEPAITPRTKVIVPVHYAGVACEMDVIMGLADKYGLYVVEDAAQAMMSTYKGKALGAIGHMGCYSFHETKNVTSGGEGGLLVINDNRYSHRAEIIRDKGTNRTQFFRGVVDKYSWIDIGSSYLLSELQAAYLWGQLEKVGDILENRLASRQQYVDGLSSLSKQGYISLPVIPEHCLQNGHMFYLKVSSLEVRSNLINHLRKNGIYAVFHYVPLHSSAAGSQYGYFCGEDRHTTVESDRLLRLPMYFGLKKSDVDFITKLIISYFGRG